MLGRGACVTFFAVFAPPSNAVDADSFQTLCSNRDTGRYVLAPKVLAFGVRTMRGNPHADFETLNLYVTRNNELESVLAGLVTYSLFGEPQGPDGCSRSSETKHTLAVAKTGNHGLANLVVQEKLIEQEQTAVKDRCEIDETKSSHRYVLQFDGKKYFIPKQLQE